MQSRSFFTFGVNFSFLTDSVFVNQERYHSSPGPFPPVSNYLITENDDFIITEGADNLITE